MVNYNLCGFLILFAISLTYALILWSLLHKDLRALIDKVVKIPEATIFYASSFSIAFFSIILSTIFGTSFQLKADAPRMEYVWKIASGLSEVLEGSFWFLVVFLVIVTLLVIVLKRKNDA